ncbi:MAG: CopD family protein [Deltaproteobacteria bacterium]|nr:CopD family protein [Deltaproteobacteria bacterium]
MNSPVLWQILLVVHIIGFVMWVGTLIGASHVLKAHAEAGPGAGKMFDKLEKSFAIPMDIGATFTIVAGLLLIFARPGGTAILKGAGFMHTKLLLVAFLIVGHGILRKKLGQFRRGQDLTPPAGWLFPVVNISAWAIVILIIVRPF